MKNNGDYPFLPFMQEPMMSSSDRMETVLYVGRKTNDGNELTKTTAEMLRGRGYQVDREQFIGTRRNGRRRHRVDIVASYRGRTILVECKWQNVGGTGKDKVLSDIIDLSHNVTRSNGHYSCAYIVFSGKRWDTDAPYLKNREYLHEDATFADNVHCISLDDLYERALTHTL